MLKKISLPFLFIFFITLHSAKAQYVKIFDIDRSNYPEISAKFIAIDSVGRQIYSINNQDFKITENNQAVPVTSLQNAPTGVNPISLSIVMAVDVSGSMETDRMKIAQDAARTVVQLTPLARSEIAITSFDHKNYLNQDFTRREQDLYNAIDSLHSLGGTDYNYAFTKPVGGALHVAKKGLNKKVVIFLTDGLSDGNMDSIIIYANKNNITVYCVTLEMPMPEILQKTAEKTEGRHFANVKTGSELNDIYTEILQIEQSAAYGTVKWTASPKYAPEYTKISAKIDYRNEKIKGKTEYETTENELVKLKITYNRVNFGKQQVGSSNLAKIDIEARNTAQKITKISNTNNQIFELEALPQLPYKIEANSNTFFNVIYKPKDEGWITSKIKIETEKGQIYNLFVTGGNPSLPSKFDNSLGFVFPKKNSAIFANTDTVINWKGINYTDSIELFFSKDNGQTYSKIGEANNLKTKFFVQQNEAPNCKLKIQKQINLKESTILDTSYFEEVSFSKKSGKFSLFTQKKDSIFTYNQNKRLESIFTVRNNKELTIHALSPDNKFVVLAYDDNTIEIFNKNTNRRIKKIDEYRFKISEIVFSEDGKFFAVNENTNNVKTIRTADGQIVDILYKKGKRSKKIDFSPDNSQIAVAFNDHEIVVQNIDNKQSKTLKKHSKEITVLQFNTAGNKLLSASKDGKNIVWDLQTGKKQVLNHKGEIFSAQWIEENRIISTSQKNTAIIWNLTEKPKKIVLKKHESDVLDAKICERNQTIATLGKDKTVNIWQMPTGKHIKKIKISSLTPEKIVYFNEKEIIIKNQSDPYDIFSIKDTLKTKQFFFTQKKKAGGLIVDFGDETADVKSAYFRKSDNSLLITTTDKSARLRSLKKQVLILLEGISGFAKFSNNETKIFGKTNNSISIRNGNNGKLIKTIGGGIEGHQQNVNLVAISPDDKILATSDEGGKLKLWNIETSKIIETIDLENAADTIIFSADATKLVVNTQKTFL